MTHEIAGRDAELGVMRDWLARADAGALVLAGEAGIGKTTLWRWCTVEARAVGMRVLACSPSRDQVRGAARDEVPEEGAIPGVKVIWGEGSTPLLSELEKHGTVSKEQQDSRTAGDGPPKGIVQLVFRPKKEKVPGFGQVRRAIVVFSGVAL